MLLAAMPRTENARITENRTAESTPFVISLSHYIEKRGIQIYLGNLGLRRIKTHS